MKGDFRTHGGEGAIMGREDFKFLTRVGTMNRHAPSPRTLTPALSHPMGEGEFLDVLLERPPRFMGSKREPSLGSFSPRPSLPIGGEGEEESVHGQTATH